MLKNVIEFFQKYFIVLAVVVAFICSGYIEYQKQINPPSLQDFKGGIQNHLVWNVKGECYFVRPFNGTTIYLVRVEDCDKK